MLNESFALLIGIGHYAQVPRLDVPITAVDARAIGDTLRDNKYGGYPSEQITVLTNETATRVGVLRELEALVRSCSDKSSVVIFYCGHGIHAQDGTYYLTTHDTVISSTRDVNPDTAVSQTDILTRLRRIRSRRVLLIVNACHAGNIQGTLDLNTVSLGQSLPDTLAEAVLDTGEGRVIITACRATQVSYIGRGALTLFTQAIVDGLCCNGTEYEAGYVSVYDLYTHVYKTVSTKVREDYKAIQEPVLTMLNNIGPFFITRTQTKILPETPEITKHLTTGVVHTPSPDTCHVAYLQLTQAMRFSGPANTASGTQINISGNQANTIIGTVSGSEVYIGPSNSDRLNKPRYPLSTALTCIRIALKNAQLHGDNVVTVKLQIFLRELESAQDLVGEARIWVIQRVQRDFSELATKHSQLLDVARIVQYIDIT